MKPHSFCPACGCMSGAPADIVHPDGSRENRYVDGYSDGHAASSVNSWRRGHVWGIVIGSTLGLAINLIAGKWLGYW